MLKPSAQIRLKPSPKPILTTPKAETDPPVNSETNEIHSKNTSPTLVDFQNRNAELPDWRLQLKNAVQQRIGKTSENENSSLTIQSIQHSSSKTFKTSGANALKTDFIEETKIEQVEDERLANALKRIELSRQKYLVTDQPVNTEVPDEEKPVKDYPFKIAARNANPVRDAKTDQKSGVEFPNKPKLVPKPQTNISNNLFDTSELDPEFVPAKVSSSFTKAQNPEKHVPTNKSKQSETENNKSEKTAKMPESDLPVVNEVEELAPFVLRFNAGIFDLIIGSFSSLVLLSPFMLLGGDWFSVSGFFAFLATGSIVMFIYLTTTIGLFGKSFGMHLFSLELVDYASDEFPSLHQSAVRSSIFLLSIAFCGLGFLTVFFDEDKRAVHDLVSGTIIVKEI